MLKTLRGVHKVEEYLAASADSIGSGSMEFHDVVADNGNCCFRWVLTIRCKLWASGMETQK